MSLKDTIRTIPDFPKPGIMYRDITTLLADPAALAESIKQIVNPFRGGKIDYVAGIDARGFIFGTGAALELGVGFVPIRKKGKLPYKTYEQDYVLEYGTDTLQIHADAVGEGDKVLLIDDLIATGGTAMAAAKLLQRTGAQVISAAFVVDLPDLGGAQSLKEAGIDVHALVAFEGH